MHNHATIADIARLIARTNGFRQKNNGVFEGDKCICAGQVVSGEMFVYHDKKIVIFTGMYDLSLEIVIREGVTSSGLSNPVFMATEEGELYRSHGEIAYVTDHIMHLARGIIDSGRERPLAKSHKWSTCRIEDCEECQELVYQDILMACDDCGKPHYKESYRKWTLLNNGRTLCGPCSKKPDVICKNARCTYHPMEDGVGPLAVACADCAKTC